MRGDGGRVEQVFAAWLSSQGWQVRRQVGYMDVVAERNGQRLVAEVKGRTGSPGLDVDTLFGQLLRRMAGGDDSTRYAVVVPAGLPYQATPSLVMSRDGAETWGVEIGPSAFSQAR